MYSTVRAWARSIALQIPPIRRLYLFALAQRDQAALLAQTVDRLRASNASMGAQLIEQTTALATAEQAARVAALVPPEPPEPQIVYVADAGADGREAALRAERDRARETAVTAREAAAQIIGVRDELMAELTAAREAFATALAQGAAAEQEVAELHRHVEHLQAEAAMLIAHRSASEAAVEAAESALAETRAVAEARMQEARSTTEARMHEAAAAVAERDVLRGRVELLERKIEQHEARMAEHAMAEARIALLMSEIESGQGDAQQLKALKADLALVKGERDALSARAQQVENEALERDANVRELAARAQTLEQDVTARDQRIRDLVGRAADLERQLREGEAKARTELQNRTHDLQRLDHRTMELEDAVRIAYENVKSAHEARDAARGELDKVNHELRVANAENLARVLGKLSFVEYAMQSGASAAPGSGARKELYLDLLEASLTGMLERDASQSPWTERKFDAERRLLGRDWPERAVTMIGAVRMRNLRRVVEQIIADDVAGDLIETGVWRGGACIYMRGILAAYGDSERKVWVADSFRGLPPPSPELYPADEGDRHSAYEPLAVPLEEVRNNFRRYGLLDDRVEFLPGWFKDTLPGAPIKRLSLLRLDGDMYESTIQALDSLYNKVTLGGFVIVDDYGLPGCRKAIEDFREQHGIRDELEEIDGASVFWRKAAATSAGVVVMADKRRSEQPN